ncbi:sarcosine oxidase subunit gamma [Xanthobacteraceae bacterium A53D]
MLETNISDRQTATEHIHAATRLTALAPTTRFVLQVFDAARVRLSHAGGFDLSGPVNSCIVNGERVAARVAPDEWLLLDAPGTARIRLEGLKQDLSDRVISLVEATRRKVAFQVAGARAAAVLNAGIPLDLSDEAFPAGSATATLLKDTPVILIRATRAPVYRVECARACGPAVEAFLNEAIHLRG